MKIMDPRSSVRLTKIKDTRSWWRKTFGKPDWIGLALAGLIGVLVYLEILVIAGGLK